MKDKRSYPDHPILAVSALIRNINQQILIVRRAKEPGKGLWSLPGGAVRLGEEIKEALSREVMEECSVDVIIQKLLGVHDHIVRDQNDAIERHFLIVNYQCKLPDSAQVNPASDVDKIEWLDLSRLDQFPYTPGVKQLLLEQFYNDQ